MADYGYDKSMYEPKNYFTGTIQAGSTTSNSLYASNDKRCEYCSGYYCTTAEVCPRVKSVKYYESGAIAKITFHEPDRP